MASTPGFRGTTMSVPPFVVMWTRLHFDSRSVIRWVRSMKRSNSLRDSAAARERARGMTVLAARCSELEREARKKAPPLPGRRKG